MSQNSKASIFIVAGIAVLVVLAAMLFRTTSNQTVIAPEVITPTTTLTPTPAPTHTSPLSPKQTTATTTASSPRATAATAAPKVPAASSPLSWDTIHTSARAATVNIFCTNILTDDPDSGTGVIIDPRGIILTNAHVAIDFLLTAQAEKGNVDCSIRNGSPAYPRYKASLLYISPEWVVQNKEYVAYGSTAQTTVDNDYALLLITKSIGSNPLPDRFPFMSLAATTLDESGLFEVNGQADTGNQEQFLFTGYPRGTLGPDIVRSQLYMKSTFAPLFSALSPTPSAAPANGTAIKKRLVFDVPQFAQQGASGSPVVNTFGTVSALVTLADRDANGKLNGMLEAFSVEAISKTFEEKTGKGLGAYLQGDLQETSKQFMNTTGKELERILEAQLQKSFGN